MRVLQKTVRAGRVAEGRRRSTESAQPRLNDLLRGKIDKFILDAPFDRALSREILNVSRT